MVNNANKAAAGPSSNSDVNLDFRMAAFRKK